MAGMQWYQSEEARKANAKERKAMKAMIDKIEDPYFDPSTLTPEEYQVAAKYVPEMAAYVQEVAPTVVQESQDMAAGRRAQREALQKLSEIGSSRGIDPQMQALGNEAARRAQTEAQVRQQSILQDAARRGQQGSAATIAAQLMGSSQGMDRAAQTQNQLAAQAYQQRLQALADSGQLGGQIKMQDADLQGNNANIINAFNQRNASNRQSYLNRGADTSNQAQMYNIGQIQDIANRNVQNRNTYDQYNQQRADQNSLDGFNAATQKANIYAGQSAQAIASNNQTAADRNQAIQGGGNAITGYFQNSAAQDAEKARQDREDRRLQYQQTGEWGS
jgi:hypothetical protein